MPVVAMLLGAVVPALLLVAHHLFTIAVDRCYRGFDVPEPEAPDPDVTWMARQRFEDVSITSADGLTLRGSYLAAKAPTNRVVILAHGYRGNAKKDMGVFAELYHERFGYNVLLPDARAHGASEGRYIGFGWPERLDYLRWIDCMIQRHGPDATIVLHGLSMGAATVMMTSGERLPEQVACVVADCGYTSAEEELSHELRRMYHLPAFPLIPLASLICKLRAGYSLADASALAQVRKSATPILFIHGGADAFVPTRMVYSLHDACPAPKALLIVPEAEHAMAIVDAPELYAETVAAFLHEWVPSR
jgi:fermentation-respiration switch protein FrsA (DUF1100 family)